MENLKNDYDVKVPIGEKIGWALGEFGQNLIMNFMASFGLAYYTIVLGVDPLVWAGLLIAYKVIDSFNDIGSGWLLDNLRLKLPGNWSKGSYARPWLALSTPLWGIVSLIPFLLKPSDSMTAKIIWLSVYAILNGFVLDLVNGSHGIIYVRMSQRQKDRNAMSTIAGIFVLIAATVIFMVVPIFLKPEMTRDQQHAIYRAFGFAFAIAFIILSLISVFTTTERVKVEEVLNQEGRKYKWYQSIIMLYRNRPNFFLFLSNIMKTFGEGIMVGLQIFYFQYFFMSTFAMTIASAVSINFTVISAILAPRLARKFGKTKLYGFSLALAAVFHILRFFTPAGNIVLLILFGFPVGIGTGIAVALGAAIGADVNDYYEHQTGIRAEGAMGLAKTSLRKLLTIFSGAIPALILGFTGFDENLTTQPDSAISGIRIASTLVIGVFYGLAYLIFKLGYKLTDKDLKIMLDELAEKRNSAIAGN